MARPAAPADAGLSKRLAKLVGIARRFQALKEDAKHHSLRELAVLRRAVLALDRQLGLGGLVFHLTFDEIATVRGQETKALRAIGTAPARRSGAPAGCGPRFLLRSLLSSSRLSRPEVSPRPAREAASFAARACREAAWWRLTPV